MTETHTTPEWTSAGTSPVPREGHSTPQWFDSAPTQPVFGPEPPRRHPLLAELAQPIPSDQIDKGGARVGVGGDQLARFDRAPVPEPHPARAPAGQDDLDDRAVVAQVGAGI